LPNYLAHALLCRSRDMTQHNSSGDMLSLFRD
jgi:hypothetical protein